MLNELRYYSRMAAGVVRMQRAARPLDPQAFIRQKVDQRESTFLEALHRAVFADPGHPYTRMFEIAGCSFGDLTNEVQRGGLESALLRLRHAGVYLSHDEWKGDAVIVRGGHQIPATSQRFKNPLVTGWLRDSSSGSTGRPVATARSTEMLLHGCAHQMLRALEFAAPRRVWIDVKSILPTPGGLNAALHGRANGTPVERWFTAGTRFREHGHYRVMTRALVLLGNAFGARAPYPSYLPYNDFSPVAEYVARRRRAGAECAVHGFASPLARVAGAALERGYDISGTIFTCGGEGLSPAKIEVFERAGARAYSSYTASEIGHLGTACRHMSGSCVHVFDDAIAAIGVPRTEEDAEEQPLDSLHFTTLTSYAPNIFVNLELDDEGVLEPAACDCVYSRLGLTRRIHRINSFGKANPQGMTFHRSDLLEVLERILPARLGGAPGDYQLVECEASSGQTQLRLNVSPRTGASDPKHIRAIFLEVMRPRWAGALAFREWTHSNGVEVEIAEPVATRTGKVHSVRLLRAYSRAREVQPGEPARAS